MFPFSKRKQKSRETIGICFQSDGVAIARVNRDSQPPQLLGCEHIPLAVNSPELSDQLESVLKKYCDKHTDTIMVLENDDFSIQMMETPQVEPAERVQAVRWKLQDIVDYDPNDAVVDVFDIPSTGERTRQPMIYVVVAQRSKLQDKTGLLLDNDVPLQAIDIPELTQRNLAELLPEDQQGVALLNLTANEGLLTLTYQSSLYLARRFDIGYRALNLPEAESDSELGLVGMSPELQRVMDQIVLEVQRSLDYYESHFGLPPINSLVVAPLAVDAPGLLSYMASQLGIQVRMLDLGAVLDLSEPMQRQLQAQCWSALGAALRQNSGSEAA